MEGGPRVERPPRLSHEAVGRWSSALGNLQDLGKVVDGLAKTLESAVYLDDNEYSIQAQLQHYKNTVKARDKRISVLEAEAELTQRELAKALAKQHSLERALNEALASNATMSQEQENTAVVFKMHYNELLAKTEELALRDEEMARLKGVIEVLQGSSSARC